MTKTLAVKEILCFDRHKFLKGSTLLVNVSGLPSKSISPNGAIVGNIVITHSNDNTQYILKNVVYYNYDETKYAVKEVSIVGILSGDNITIVVPTSVTDKLVCFLGVTSITKNTSSAVKIKYLEEI